MVHKIDGTGHTAEFEFTEGDPVAGTPYTVLTDDWLNMVQRELVAVVEAAGLTPTKGNDAQLLAALELLGGGMASNVLWNSRFTVAQRYPGGIISGGVTSPTMIADRWISDPGTGGAASVVFTPLDLGDTFGQASPHFGQFPARVLSHTQTTASDVDSFPALAQRVIGVRSLAGRTAVVSFYARTASTGVTVRPELIQHFGDGGGASAEVSIMGTAITLGGSSVPAGYAQTFTVPSIVGKTIALSSDPDSWLELRLHLPDDATYQVDFWNVRLEPGIIPRPNLWTPDELELQRCMTLFEKSHNPEESPFLNPVTGGGAINLRTDIAGSVIRSANTRYLVPKRWRNNQARFYAPGPGDPASLVDKVQVGASLYALSGPLATWSEWQTGYPTVPTAPTGAQDVSFHFVIDEELPLV